MNNDYQNHTTTKVSHPSPPRRGAGGEVNNGKTFGFVNLCVILTLISTSSLYAQSLSLNQFLKSALDNPYYKSFDVQNSFLQERNAFSLPWVNQVQFRYQDNQFNNFQSRYGLRFDAGNPWQISRNNKYFQGIQTLKGLEQKMVLKEILRDRYDLVVEFWIASELAGLVLKQKEMREQIGRVIGQKAGSASFDADQFLNAQLDIISKEADWHEANFERDVVKTKILAEASATVFDLPLTRMIDVDQINQLIQIETKAAGQTEFELLRQRVELSNRKMQLEKSNFDVGFLQAMYSSNRQIDGRNSFGLAFGVTIPITNPNKENVAREKLNVLERQGELEQFQSEEKNKRLNSVLYLQLHLNHYQKLDSLVTAVKSRGMNLLTGQASNYDPVIELKYREKLIQFDMLKIRIKKEILLQYISYLDNSDKLHERPLVNYLSKDLERVE